MERQTNNSKVRAQYVKNLKGKSSESAKAIASIKDSNQRDSVVDYFIAHPETECTPANIEDRVKEYRSKLGKSLNTTPPQFLKM